MLGRKMLIVLAKEAVSVGKILCTADAAPYALTLCLTHSRNVARTTARNLRLSQSMSPPLGPRLGKN